MVPSRPVWAVYALGRLCDGRSAWNRRLYRKSLAKSNTLARGLPTIKPDVTIPVIELFMK
ncbi:MAG: hypothetical protein WCO51_03710 [bacterium]